MLKLAIPLLHVADSAAAEDFYCNRLGFRWEFAHRAVEAKADPCYMSVTRDGIWLHLSSFSGDGVSGGVVNLLVEDVDALAQRACGKRRTNRYWPGRPDLGHARDGSKGCRWQLRSVHRQ